MQNFWLPSAAMTPQLAKAAAVLESVEISVKKSPSLLWVK
jgi:hypothetical protein